MGVFLRPSLAAELGMQRADMTMAEIWRAARPRTKVDNEKGLRTPILVSLIPWLAPGRWQAEIVIKVTSTSVEAGGSG